jgi:hypothetical protein
MKNNPAQIIIKNVRFAYVHVFEKDELADKYTCRILVPKNSPQIEDIKGCIAAACTCPDGMRKLGGTVIPWTEVLHDGDAKQSKEGQSVHPGFWYLNAKSTNKPGVVKINPTGVGGKTMAITDESEFYSGCYGWADVGFFAFNQGVNRGISVGLNNVLKTGGEDGLGNGQYMGGRSSAESVFGAEIEADDMPAGDDDLC